MSLQAFPGSESWGIPDRKTWKPMRAARVLWQDQWTACWLAEHGVFERGKTACDGALVRAHLIPKRVLLRELPAEVASEVMWREEMWVPCCGGINGSSGHHGAFDVARTIRVPRAALPDRTVALAEELGLGWYVDREFRR